MMMKKILFLARGEMADAKNYASMALENKKCYPEAAKMFATLSEQEHGHAAALIAMAGKMAKSDDDHAIYEYESAAFSMDVSELKRMWEVYKNGGDA